MINVVKLNLTAALLLVFSTILVSPLSAKAQDAEAALNCGANLQLQTSGCASSAGDPGGGIEDTIKTVINILTVLVGIVAVIMIVIAGFKYITSNGDSGAVSSAKNTIIYAIVGLVVVALAQVIVRFVISKVTVEPGSGTP